MKHEVIELENARIMVWQLTESVETLKGQLDMTEQEKIGFDKINSDKRRLEFLGIRVALNALLGKEIHIEYDLEGKPHLSDRSYQISISHSNKWIAVMAHPSRMVGIDIECPTDKIQKLYRRFLSRTEQAELSDGKDIRQLLLAWSGKEALYKIIGKEAVDFATQLRIFPFEVKPSGSVKAQHIPSDSYFQLFYQLTEQYALVYCLA